MRRGRTWFGVMAFVVVAVAAACTSFGGSDGTGPADAGAGAGDAGAQGDGPTSAGDATSTGCATFTSTSLYVAGGFWVPDAGYSEPDDVLRARICADGSLGAWTTTTKLPRTAQVPVAAVLGDTMLYLGGQHDNGGPNYESLADYAQFDSAGELGPFLSVTTTAAETQIWRAPFASNGTTVVVAGGEVPLADGGNLPTSTMTLWTSVNGVPTPAAGPPLPAPVSRGGAAMFGDTMFVLGSGAIYARNPTVDGGTWSSVGTYADADFSTAASATALYVVAGDNDDKGVVVMAYVSGQLAAARPATAKLPIGMFGAAAVVAEGRLYVIGGAGAAGGTMVVSAKLTANDVTADGFTQATPLPAPRFFSAAFAR